MSASATRDVMDGRDLYSVHFRLSGPALDVDAVVAAARPAGACDVWRRGEPMEGAASAARTSGLQVEIGDFDDEIDALAAIEAFLDAEAAFLTAASRFASDESPAVLACALWVYADEPVGLSLPPDLLERLAASGIGLEIQAYPRADD